MITLRPFLLMLLLAASQTAQKPPAGTATLEGRLYDFNRKPIASAQIQVLTLRYDNLGQRILERPSAILPVHTDERGEYRFTGIPPGDYYVRTSQKIAATYYPGVIQPDEAIPIRVTAGANLQA